MREKLSCCTLPYSVSLHYIIQPQRQVTCTEGGRRLRWWESGEDAEFGYRNMLWSLQFSCIVPAEVPGIYPAANPRQAVSWLRSALSTPNLIFAPLCKVEKKRGNIWAKCIKISRTYASQSWDHWCWKPTIICVSRERALRKFNGRRLLPRPKNLEPSEAYLSRVAMA